MMCVRILDPAGEPLLHPRYPSLTMGGMLFNVEEKGGFTAPLGGMKMAHQRGKTL